MILSKVTIKNFLSIRGPVSIDIDPNVTVLMGANDHGKTNILQALCTLNSDQPIKDTQCNWDAKGAPPEVTFDLRLSPAEQNELTQNISAEMETQEATLKGIEEEDHAQEEAEEPVSATVTIGALSAKSVQTPGTRPAVVEADDEKDTQPSADDLKASIQTLQNLKKEILSGSFEVQRLGAATGRAICKIQTSDIPESTLHLINKLIPRVELFNSNSLALQDSVTSEQISGEDFEFMQGIFYSAGLDPMQSRSLFSHTDETEVTLDEASKKLQVRMQELWAQGAELGITFELRHRNDSIELLARDPSVQARKTRMSSRSAGVTQFFRLSMALYARQQKHPANSYLYLFDEPGIFLHPRGQRDLLQVFEELSSESQIAYATHSLFLLNQNFIERHRLITRDYDGTRIDQKPYRNNWALALEEMVGLDSANILFASSVLLTEGDSDGFYIVEMLRYLNDKGLLDFDINQIAIYSYRDHHNLRYLAQRLLERRGTKISILFDGDSMGKRYEGLIEDLAKAHPTDLFRERLDDGMSTEDFVLYEDLFLSAALETLQDAQKSEGLVKHVAKKKDKELQVEVPPLTFDALKASWKAKQLNGGEWFKQQAQTFVREREAASKVVLARTYVQKARRHSTESVAEKARVNRALKLCKELQKTLEVPARRATHQLLDME